MYVPREARRPECLHPAAIGKDGSRAASAEDRQCRKTHCTACAGGSYLYYRHTLPVRIMHWINVVALTILFMSGLQIFNAHPALTGASRRTTARRRCSTISSRVGRRTAASPAITRVFGHEFDTTGVLGVSEAPNGRPVSRGVSVLDDDPGHAVAVDGARLALLLRVGVRGQRHRVRRSTRSAAGTWRATWRRRGDDLAGIGASIRITCVFRHPPGEAAKRYNVLQKLAYLVVIFVLLPLVILMGFAMSPWLNSLLAGLGRHLRRPAVGADDPLHRRLAARRRSC